jgi:hypothetical protein
MHKALPSVNRKELSLSAFSSAPFIGQVSNILLHPQDRKYPQLPRGLQSSSHALLLDVVLEVMEYPTGLAHTRCRNDDRQDDDLAAAADSPVYYVGESFLRLFDRIIWLSRDLFFAVDRDYTADICWRGVEEFDRKKYIQSLKRLSAMPVDCVLAGHLLHCTDDAFRLLGHAYSKALIELR